VDSVKVGNLATAPNVYNQYRVDVSTNFPGFNNTGGPGAGGPVGAFFLDTTKLTNGVHTIYWIATDDAGAADGIGSRYFNVVNTGTSANEIGHCEPLGVAISPHVFSLSHREERSDGGKIGDMDSFRVPDFSLETILNLPLSFSPLTIKCGFNLAAPAETLIPANYGSYHIDIKEVELFVIFLGPGRLDTNNPPTPPFRKGGNENGVVPTIRQAKVESGDATPFYAGYQIVGDQLRPLPIGSTLDRLKGTFSWLPGPGFLGKYDLVFVAEDAFGITKRIPVNVTIKPKLEKP